MYYIWQAHDRDIWISIFEMNQWEDKDAECIFVGRPDKLIGKYKQNTNDDG